jgi:hypothetical protein
MRKIHIMYWEQSNRSDGLLDAAFRSVHEMLIRCGNFFQDLPRSFNIEHSQAI